MIGCAVRHVWSLDVRPDFEILGCGLEIKSLECVPMPRQVQKQTNHVRKWTKSGKVVWEDRCSQSKFRSLRNFRAKGRRWNLGVYSQIVSYTIIGLGKNAKPILPALKIVRSAQFLIGQGSRTGSKSQVRFSDPNLYDHKTALPSVS